MIDEGFLKPTSSARYVIQHAEYGYTSNLPFEIVLQDTFLLATHFDGQPLSPDHGFPLRGVVGFIPDLDDLKTPYFWKGAKWLRGLEFKQNDKPGFWERAGYHNDGDVWLVEGIKYNWTLLRITADNGLTGVGEATNWPGSPLVYHAARHVGDRPHV